ncbi:MAG: primary-amine oxidase [Cyanobacteria bacterium J06633_2]
MFHNFRLNWNRWFRFGFFLLLITVCIVTIGLVRPSHPQTLPRHPLDPLTKEEITTAVDVIRQSKSLSDAAVFPQISLKEPDKQMVLGFRDGDVVARSVFAIVYEREQNQTFEAEVDMATGTVTSWREIPGVQPALTDPEFELANEVVKSDPRWQEAMRKRGLTDFDQLEVSAWAPGVLSLSEKAAGDRIVRALTYFAGDGFHYYGRPIEGVMVVVNLNNGTVEEFVDTGVVALSRTNWDYDTDSVGPLKAMARPLRMIQPEGRNFEINGNQVSWRGWSFRYAMHPRDGLVLYQVTYDDGNQVRPVMYRASLSEMVVPYSDPNPTWSFRNAFDVGEYNFGVLASIMTLGKDIPSNGVLLDAVFADAYGEPYDMPGVVGIYERDRGILWKHYDYVTDQTYARRDRDLVVAVTGAIDNYDYGINWIFHQDGSIEVETDSTGIILIQASDAERVEDEVTPYGTLVAKNIVGITHQHFFGFRLDLDVDGSSNSVMRAELEQFDTSAMNPIGNAFQAQYTSLNSEADAVSDVDLTVSRKWMISSSDKRNSIGAPTSYVLLPTANASFAPGLDSKISQEAGFATHHFWVTKYDPDQLYAAGDYPNQGRADQGLPSYIANDESISDEDVVVWYTLGVSHVTRVEDWPVMPVHREGFKLIPRGFFDRNPAINLPDEGEPTAPSP